MFCRLPGWNFEFLDSSQDGVMGKVDFSALRIVSLTVQNFGLQIQASFVHLPTDLPWPKDIPLAVLPALRRRDPGSSPYAPQKCIQSPFRRISGVKNFWEVPTHKHWVERRPWPHVLHPADISLHGKGMAGSWPGQNLLKQGLLLPRSKNGTFFWNTEQFPPN